MEEQRQQQEQQLVINKAKKKPASAKYAILVLAAFFLFGSGWALGADKLSLRSSDVVASLTGTRAEAPEDGLDELYSELVKNFDGETNDADLLDGIKSGLISAAGDPFTEYLSQEDTVAFNEGLNGSFEGIGAELGKEGNFVIIISPIKGTPADIAGIQPGDVIIEIDGESAADITISEAVQRIRGEKGTTVTLQVVRDGVQVEVPIVRDTISIASVEWRQEDGVGIIQISRFGSDTVKLTQQAAQEMKDAGVTKIVLDMRGNPGGLLDAAVGVSSVWLPKGSTVLEEKRGDVVIKTFKSNDQPILSGVSTIVLQNEGSASASEIVAGALRDNNAATIIGTTSFGKGSVQQLIELNAGGSLKVTIARWFTPAGKNIDKEGISPDTEVVLTAEDRAADLDPQLDAAKAQLQ